ncbi:MAG: VanW family protein [Rhodospirillales bacterium]
MSISTTKPHIQPAATDVPTRAAALLFQAKVMAHRAKRLVRDFGNGPARLGKIESYGFDVVAGQSRTALWSDGLAQERQLQLGKVQNLRRAAAALDGVAIPQGTVFSFWKQIGRASRRRGYVAGRMLQQGCMVPAVGGGLCQLSNALYDAALQAGCEIVERHAHSRIVPGSQAALGRDATVAWNYVDLRLRSPRDLRLQVQLDKNELLVQFVAREPIATMPSPIDLAFRAPDRAAQSCDTCNEIDCFRHIKPSAPSDRTTFVLDGMTPEFGDYVKATRRSNDVLALPIDGQRWRMARYAWPTDGFNAVHSAPLVTLQRSLQSRRLAAQGAARQQALLHHAEILALALARRIPVEATELCVAQSLLPFLWRNGDLGGRQVTVLMTRLPMDVLQARLDAVLAQHPDSTTLGDFRAPAELVRAEREALDYADRIVTPHSEVAGLFAGKAELLPWHNQPATPALAPTQRVAFVGPTLGRKGAYEMRDGARALGLELVVGGSDLEAAEFWSGIAIHRGTPLQAEIVVQPAYVEDNPRSLLTALASGRQVIATPACGLKPQPGLTLIPFGDSAALVEALRVALDR